jgi:hypothetical protein
MLLYPRVPRLPGSVESLLQPKIPFSYQSAEPLQLLSEIVNPGHNVLTVGEADIAIHPRVL